LSFFRAQKCLKKHLTLYGEEQHEHSLKSLRSLEGRLVYDV